jgi:oligoribonuclease NrnB/cAMP/cGMP phosphodiesterase (DHH superfamily)
MFVLIDHHKTAEWLNKYWWAEIKEYITTDIKNSGTMAFYSRLRNDGVFDNNGSTIFDFAEIVRKYDTYEWKTKYNELLPKQVNDLFHILGRDRFMDYVLTQFKNNNKFELSQQDIMLLKTHQEKIDTYIESKNKQLIQRKILNYNTGIIFAEQFISELGNKLCELNPDIDFVIIINPAHSISYRTIKDIDLSEIAKMFGGGGHKAASGSPISDNVRNDIIKMIFNLQE